MLLVKTKIGPSTIEGIGLFAAEPIAKGTKVWEFHPKLDTLWVKAEIDVLSPASREQFNRYSFFDTTHETYMFCGDDGRFFNHSDDPNCDDSMNNATFAVRDIAIGEELTVNYKDFYGNMDEHAEIQ